MPWSKKKEVVLWRHQAAARDIAFDRLMKYGFFWLQAECATGKTLASLIIAQHMGAQKILVLTTQAAASDAWKKNVTEKIEGLDLVLLDKGSVAVRAKALLVAATTPGPSVTVINYEAAARMTATIAAARYPFVIADESHKLKSYDSSMSQGLALATATARYRVAMTGTPWEDRPTDVFGQVRWGIPGPRPTRGYVTTPAFGTWTKFFETYVDYVQLPGGIKKPIGYKNQADLRAKIAPYSLRIRAEDIYGDGDDTMPRLPEALHITRLAVLSAPQSKLYHTLRKDKVAHGEGGAITVGNPLTMGMRLQQIANGYYQPDDKDTVTRLVGVPTKTQVVLEILEELGSQPVVIFTRFQEDVAILKESLEGAGYKNIKRLIGGLHEHNEFQAGDGQIILVNMAAGAEGVELTRARYGIFYSIDYSRTAYTQALARIRRPTVDAGKPVTYFHIHARGTIDELLLKIIQGKGDVAEELANGLMKL